MSKKITNPFDIKNYSQWLDGSFADSKAFWLRLMRYQASLFGSPAGTLAFEAYNFYDDMLARNIERLQQERPWYKKIIGANEHQAALVTFDENGKERRLSYQALKIQVDSRAEAWRQAGVIAGQKIAIIYPEGGESLVNMLAALKLGLVFSILPPAKKLILQQYLAAIQPDYIIIDQKEMASAGDWQSRRLTAGSSEVANAPINKIPAYVYQSGEIACIGFDPASPTPFAPRALPADLLYLCAIRDGLVTLALQPGDRWAMPGFSMQFTQPAAFLLTLLCGATYLQVDQAAIVDNPALLSKKKLAAIGVTPETRNACVENGEAVGKDWQFWFYTPETAQEIEKWQTFIDLMGLKNVACGAVKWQSTIGSLLFAPRRKGKVSSEVLPAAGMPWAMADLADESLPAKSKFGLLTAQFSELEKPLLIKSRNLIRQDKSGKLIFMGEMVRGEKGRHYPAAFVSEFIKTIPGCADCKLVEIASATPAEGPVFVMLVFSISKKELKPGSLKRQIEGAIRNNLGETWLPDRVEILNLYPRQETGEGEIPGDWVQTRYLTGKLAQLSKNRVFQELSNLRYQLVYLKQNRKALSL